MDRFRGYQSRQTGPGGLKCHCCNPSRGKKKNSHVGKSNMLNKKARMALKRDLQDEAFEYSTILPEEDIESED